MQLETWHAIHISRSLEVSKHFAVNRTNSASIGLKVSKFKFQLDVGEKNKIKTIIKSDFRVIINNKNTIFTKFLFKFCLSNNGQ